MKKLFSLFYIFKINHQELHTELVIRVKKSNYEIHKQMVQTNKQTSKQTKGQMMQLQFLMTGPGSKHKKARKKIWPKKVDFDLGVCIWKKWPVLREKWGKNVKKMAKKTFQGPILVPEVTGWGFWGLVCIEKWSDNFNLGTRSAICGTPKMAKRPLNLANLGQFFPGFLMYWPSWI